MWIIDILRKYLNFVVEILKKIFKKQEPSHILYQPKPPDVHDFLEELTNSLKLEGLIPPSKDNILDIIDVVADTYREELLRIITDPNICIEKKKEKLIELYDNPFKSKRLFRLKKKLYTIVQEKVSKYKHYVKPEQLPWGLRITLKTYGLDTIEDLEELFEKLRKKIFERGFEDIKNVINITIEEIKQSNNPERLKELIEKKLKDKLEFTSSL